MQAVSPAGCERGCIGSIASTALCDPLASSRVTETHRWCSIRLSPFAVARPGALGIPEYFLYDREWNRLMAYRLPAPEARVYAPIVPNHGLYESQVLGLEVRVAEDQRAAAAEQELARLREELARRSR